MFACRRVIMADVPPDYRDLFDAKAFLTFVTLMPDGTPHPTPTWVGYDSGEDPTEPWEQAGEPRILVNTASGRQKDQNVKRDPRVAGTILDPEDPYRYLSFQGRVAERTTEGAVEHIDALAKRYMGVDEYPNRGDEDGERVVYHIELDSVLTG